MVGSIETRIGGYPGWRGLQRERLTQPVSISSRPIQTRQKMTILHGNPAYFLAQRLRLADLYDGLIGFGQSCVQVLGAGDLLLDPLASSYVAADSPIAFETALFIKNWLSLTETQRGEPSRPVRR